MGKVEVYFYLTHERGQLNIKERSMKLLIITVVNSFEENVKQILKSNKVASYSYNEVVGYRDSSLDNVSANWFGTGMHKAASTIFFVFISESQANDVYDDIESFNEQGEVKSKIHVFITPVEKTNTKV